MPKKNSKKGKQSASPEPAERYSSCDAADLHKLCSQSQKLLQRATAKRKAKWKPTSQETIDLVLKFIEENKNSVCGNMNEVDKKMITKHVTELTMRIKDVCQDRLSPPRSSNPATLRSALKQHTQSLAESQQNLKQLECNISKLRQHITEKEEEMAALESG